MRNILHFFLCLHFICFLNYDKLLAEEYDVVRSNVYQDLDNQSFVNDDANSDDKLIFDNDVVDLIEDRLSEVVGIISDVIVKEDVSEATQEAVDDQILLEELFGQDEEFDYGVFDPHEKFNRKMFKIHKKIDNIVYKPITKAYMKGYDGWFSDRVFNFFNNLYEVRNMVNCVALGEYEKSFERLGRFVVNSSVGVLGIFDIVEMNNGPKYEDVTLDMVIRRSKSSDEKYIIVPGMGPMTYSYALSIGMDTMINPLYLFFNPWAVFGFSIIHWVNIRAGYLKMLNDESSIDEYAKWRNLYVQYLENDSKSLTSIPAGNSQDVVNIKYLEDIILDDGSISGNFEYDIVPHK